MRRHRMRFCVVLILLVSVGAASASSTTSARALSSPARSLTANQRVTPARFLRNFEALEEERGGFDTAVDALTKGATNIINKTKLTLKMQTGDELLKSLKLGDNMKAVIASPKLKDLMKYVDKYNKAHPKKKISTIGTLIGKYGDDEVAEALVSATRNPIASPAKEIAKNLKKDQVAFWLDNRETINGVFKLLKIENDGWKAFGSPKLEMFERFVYQLNLKNSKHETLFTALKAGFGEGKLATLLIPAKYSQTGTKVQELQTAQFDEWLVRKINPADVYKEVFKIDKSDASALQRIVVSEYKARYERFMGIGPTIVRPSRV